MDYLFMIICTKPGKKFLLLPSCLLITMVLNAQITLTSVTFENSQEPAGILKNPLHFGWETASARIGTFTTAYQIVVASSPEKLATGDVYRSPKINRRESNSAAISFPGLRSGELYYWKLRVWDDRGQVSPWSIPHHFITGIFTKADWKKAKWISLEKMPDSLRIVPGKESAGAGDSHGQADKRSIVPLLSREFPIGKKIRSALLFVSGVGQYTAEINHIKVGKAFLAPGWTDYDKTVLYNSFDVTAMLRPGTNYFSALVGNGFYNVDRERYHKFYNAYGYPAFICRLKIVFDDDSSLDVVSDSSWNAKPSPVTYSSVYGGEDYDAGLESSSGNSLHHAVEVTAPAGKLAPEADYPVQVMDSFSVKAVASQGPGRYVYDFGQNASGIVRLKVKGKAGAVIRITPGELLTKQGEINQAASGAPCYFQYRCKGGEEEVWQPAFTYYGFRYVLVEGAIPVTEKQQDTLPVLVNLTALHTRNAAPVSGEFSCSSDLLNRIYRLIQWAIKSNMQSIITDCPHREKLGWLEEDYLMGSSIHYNFEIQHLYRQIINDMMDAQDSSGLIPDIAPEYVPFADGFRDSPEWGSSSVILPWLVYKWYGDTGILRTAYPMMRRYVTYLEGKSVNHLLNHGLGDWYDYGPNPPGNAQLTPVMLTASAFFFHDAGLLSRIAALLGKEADAGRFSRLAAEIRKSFNDTLFDSTKMSYATGSQTSMAIPLDFNIVEEKNRKAVLQNLVDSVNAHNKSLTAGDIGFHFLIEALDKGGESQLIYDMNNRDDVPGYGFQLRRGATALTESWPALEEVSNNHLMLGHLMEWFFTGLLGIDQDSGSVAYRHLRIRPQPVGDLRFARGRFHSPYGWINSSWKKSAGGFELDLDVPVNATATVCLPVQGNEDVFLNGKKTDVLSRTASEAIIEVKSGRFHFTVK